MLPSACKPMLCGACDMEAHTQGGFPVSRREGLIHMRECHAQWPLPLLFVNISDASALVGLLTFMQIAEASKG